MIVYIYNIGVDLYNGFNGLRHRINWTYFSVLDGLAHPLYSQSVYLIADINNFGFHHLKRYGNASKSVTIPPDKKRIPKNTITIKLNLIFF